MMTTVELGVITHWAFRMGAASVKPVSGADAVVVCWAPGWDISSKCIDDLIENLQSSCGKKSYGVCVRGALPLPTTEPSFEVVITPLAGEVTP